MKNKIILLVGPSGSGKTSIGKELEKRGILELISFTTRQPREGEMREKDYYFLQKEDINESDVLEQTKYNNHTYGLFKYELEEKLEKGDVYFICDKHGASTIKEKYPQAIAFYIDIPLSVTVKRMKKRGDNLEDIIERIVLNVEQGEFSPPNELPHARINGEIPAEQSAEFILKVLIATKKEKVGL